MGVNIRNSEGYMDTVPFQAISGIDREVKAASKPAFRPLVYICAPCSGDVEANKKKAAEFAEYAYRNGCIPLTAHLLFPFMDDTDKAERDTAIYMDIVLMGKCQEVWVLKERITHGMSMGIYILFEKENIDTGKMESELLLSILSSLAESEARSISENETWSIQKRFRNGTYKIAYPPYGYDRLSESLSPYL